MKLKAYAKLVDALAKKYPNAEVVYARDEEGNGFDTVGFTPGEGHFKDGEFVASELFAEHLAEYGEKLKVNAVCIN